MVKALKNGAAAVLALAATFIPTPGATAGNFHICFEGSPESRGVFAGYPNYNFEAHVTGIADGGGDGYWLVAMDNSGAIYAQGRGGIVQTKGSIDDTIKFGVSNISAYPLEYFIIRTGGAYSHDKMADYARHAKPLEIGELRDLAVSDTKACSIDLNKEKPDTTSCACR